MRRRLYQDRSAGGDSPAGPQGSPGEVSNADLAGAVAGTARNPIGVAKLDTPYVDPNAEELRLAHNAMLAALFRAPI